jgi:hypothetical protein
METNLSPAFVGGNVWGPAGRRATPCVHGNHVRLVCVERLPLGKAAVL